MEVGKLLRLCDFTSAGQWLADRVRPGLETTFALLERLGHPERNLPAVHLAGTNGKGSTAAFTASILSAAGVRVGLYTSPHLSRFTERIQVGGAEMEQERCAELIERAFRAAEEAGVEATFFEIATAAALLGFVEDGVEIAVLECGLGGRLDSTNACRPLVSVVTTIGLDHTEVLGDTVEQIAAEKAGIARRGVPLVVGRIAGGALEVIAGRAAEVGTELVRLGHEFEARPAARSAGAGDESPGSEHGPAPEDHPGSGPSIEYYGPGGALDGAELGLAGRHQVDNAAVALAAVGLLPLAVTDEARRRGLLATRWPGRLERVAPGLWLDGAHNAEGAAALGRSLASGATVARGVTLLMGMLGDKDAEAVLGALLPCARRLVCTRPDSPRALDPNRLAALARQIAAARSLPVDVVVVESPSLALDEASHGASRDGGAVVACGSLYLVGALRALVTGEGSDVLRVADPLGGPRP